MMKNTQKKVYTIKGVSPLMSKRDTEITGTIEEIKTAFEYMQTVKGKNFRSIDTLLKAINRYYKGREAEYIYRFWTLKD